jgi:hypothetical protein
MTRDQVKEVIERVLTWPRERQEDAVQMLLALEAREGELYHPDDDEWAAIEEGFAQARRREAVSADEVAALFKQYAPVYAPRAGRSPGNHGLYRDREPGRRRPGGSGDF